MNIITSQNIKSKELSSSNFLFILQLACFLIFAGRAWQHWFWDGPYRSVLWDQALLKGLVEGVFGVDWGSYVTNPNTDKSIELVTRIIGFIYTLSAISVYMVFSKFRKLATFILSIGVGFLLMMAFISFKSRFFQLGEWMEFGIQIFSPILLLMIIKGNFKRKTLVFIGSLAVALTFIGHGLYAFGFYPQPGNYVDMVINIFGWQEDAVRQILRIAGFLDFIIAFLLFVPEVSRYALIYCVIWGTLTALARLVAGFDADFALSTLNQWTFETVYRLAHGILPLWLFLITKKNSN